mmetsp:Transcript_9352/g.21252  ORF Transcript_9352/g.21252 Transcript_9352/m.21252 type:complete len:499 (+) Transcript_9352:944-2440(+)
MDERNCLVAVVRRLEGSVDRDVDVLGLVRGKLRELGAELRQVERSHLLVEVLRQDVDLLVVLVRLALVPELELGDALVRERARHDERRVSRGAAKVEQTSLGEHDDAVSVGEHEAVALRLDCDALDARVRLEASHVNLVIEVADVSDDGVVLHLLHGVHHDNVLVTRRGDEDVAPLDDVLDGAHGVSLHARLQGADGVNLGDEHARARSLHRGGGALADVTESANPGGLSGNHHVRGTHDAVGERVAAAVHVVELRLRDGVVDVDGREEEDALVLHLIETLDARRRLLGHANAALGNVLPARGDAGVEAVLDDLQDDLELRVGRRGRVGDRTALGELELRLVSLVDEERGVTAVVDDDVRATSVSLPVEHALRAPPVLLERLALPGEDGAGVARARGGGVVLRAEDVARAPAHLGAERGERLDEHGRLDGHVERSGDVGTGEGLVRSELRAARHESGHLHLGDVELHAAEVRLVNILDLVLAARGGFLNCAHCGRHGE